MSLDLDMESAVITGLVDHGGLHTTYQMAGRPRAITRVKRLAATVLFRAGSEEPDEQQDDEDDREYRANTDVHGCPPSLSPP